MSAAVIYQSKYGSTETYAKWLAEDLGAELLEAKAVKPQDLTKYSAIVYGGGLYAGSVSGIQLLTKNFESIKGKPIYLFIVGVSDMTNTVNTNVISGHVEKIMPPEIWKSVHLYCLRGGMQYSKMSFMHRTMMKMMIKMLGKKPENQLSAEEKSMIDSFGKDVNFTNRSSIAPITADIRKYLESAKS